MERISSFHMEKAQNKKLNKPKNNDLWISMTDMANVFNFLMLICSSQRRCPKWNKPILTNCFPLVKVFFSSLLSFGINQYKKYKFCIVYCVHNLWNGITPSIDYSLKYQQNSHFSKEQSQNHEIIPKMMHFI